MKKILLLIIVLACLFCFVGSAPEAQNIKWGVNFSQKQSQGLGLDWKQNYAALIDDLGAERIKLSSYWDLLEPEKGKYFFEDLDWQVNQAEQKGVDLILVIGMRTLRWPECHIPGWAKDLSKEEQQQEILELITETVSRYKESKSVVKWQVENETFFPFGECPWSDEKFLKKEADLVRSLDERPVVISDSGEGSFWFKAAGIGDEVGITMYKKVWFSQFDNYLEYPFAPAFYQRKAWIIENIFKKKVFCAELQAEPWGSKLLFDLPLEEQKKTMTSERFEKNIEFAKKTGLDEFYLWGGEWWYWLKEKQGNPEIWDLARKLF